MVPLIAMALQNRTTFIDNLSYNNSVTCFQFEKTMVRKVKLRGVLLCRNHWPRIAESSKFKLEHIQGVSRIKKKVTLRSQFDLENYFQ